MKWCLAALLACPLVAQQNPAAQAARNWRENHEIAITREFFDLLAIPNIASDLTNIKKNVAAISEILKRRGIEARTLAIPGAPPVVYGEILTPGAARTIVFYAHYDGQPLDPKEWATPPFQPVLRDKSLEQDGRVIALPQSGPMNPESRIYARSASDDKAPVIAITSALDALRAARLPLKSNIKFVFEGEEEAGSPHLFEILAAHKDLLKADVWLICDGPVHQSRRPQIVFGARGIATMDITVYGPRRELHSGHYGNWAPNPAFALARLLASMKDDDGRVLVDHYYENLEPLSATEKKALADMPEFDGQLAKELWLGRTEGGGKSLAELITLPSLNIRGMASARVGDQASNVVPASATACIDMRLVKGIDPARAQSLVIDHIRKQGWFVTDIQPDAATRMAHQKVAWVRVREGGYRSVRTSMDLPISQAVIRAVESVRGPAVKLPNSGGSVPLFAIEDAVHSPTISVPIANHDNSQHSFNENLRLQNLWDGIELMAALLTM